MQRFDATATEQLLDYPALLEILADVLDEYARGEITSPERLVIPCGGGRGMLFSMPCQAKDLVVHKLLTLYSGNPAQGLPAIQGDVTCFDAATGVPLFSLDAVTATARRTAAVTMLAIRLLRPTPPTSCLLIGTGAQATAHIGALRDLFPEMVIHVQGRTEDGTNAFCARVRQFGRLQPATAATAPDTDLVVALTTSKTPVFDAMPDPGRLVIGVGAYRPDMIEIGPNIVRNSQVYVDDIVGAHAEAGDILQAGVDWTRVKPLSAARSTPPDPRRAIFFKSVGCAAWDLAACRTVRHALPAVREDRKRRGPA